MFALKNSHVKMAVNVKTRTMVITADARLDSQERIANINVQSIQKSSMAKNLFVMFSTFLRLPLEMTASGCYAIAPLIIGGVPGLFIIAVMERITPLLSSKIMHMCLEDTRIFPGIPVIAMGTLPTPSYFPFTTKKG